ncbi:hypothetical protein [Pseudomonas sp. MYb185]|uniref:hypothetical protein n=1 Tax=Pseudomonas sp. MYb185 TaxID=1848729 RepID=UPI000CFC3B19|nr:hypothetical protein [Pseudomonas sp. MYb185]PRB83894.1 hypothetical protein CQ007_03470 [Pseudomonas sp. MYb185]
MKNTRNSPMQIWLWPVLFGLLSAAGLIVALLGEGWYDLLSWLALGLVAAVCIWFGAIVRGQS